jgi:hypothetical protein
VLLSKIDPSLKPSQVAQWIRPTEVTIGRGHLVAQLDFSQRYPLTEAVKKSGALAAFVAAADERRAVAFTRDWGLLYWAGPPVRANEFPLELFFAERALLIGLLDLIAALKSTSESGVSTALREYGVRKRALLNRNGVATPFESDLSDEESVLHSSGYAALDIFYARYLGGVAPPRDYAGRIVAEELLQSQTGNVSRIRGRLEMHAGVAWKSLSEALRWSVRARFKVLHHVVCESCDEHCVALRSDARFCSEKCATRSRMQRLRSTQ